jgi:hypothetical protein
MEGIQFNNMNMNPAEMNNMYINGNIPGFQNIGKYLTVFKPSFNFNLFKFILN